MSYPIDPAKLLRQARVLAGVGAGRGRPSPTNLRRAVSSSYYAVFHGITLAVAAHVLPRAAPPDELHRATRWVNHRDVRAVCTAVSRCAGITSPIQGLPAGLGPRDEPLWLAFSVRSGNGRVSAVPTDLQVVTDAFGSLYLSRHAADYDHLASFPKATAVGHVDDADEALTRLAAHVTDPAFQRFFGYVAMRSSGAGSR